MNRIFAIYIHQTLRLLNNKVRPIIYVNTYNISVVSGILEGIAPKFNIGVFIAFNQVYIVEIQTTYKDVNANRPSKVCGLI